MVLASKTYGRELLAIFAFSLLLAGAGETNAAILAGRWLLDEASTGDTAVDQSANADDGTYTGTTIARREEPTGFSSSTDFEQSGGGARVSGLNSASNNLSSINNDMTWAAWIKPDDLVGRERIAATSAPSSNGYGWGLNGSGMIFTHYGIEDDSSATGVIDANAWNHVAVSVSGGRAKYFVNGVQVTDNPIANGNVNNGAYQINGVGSNDELFDGSLSRVQAYSGALTPSEIQAAATVSNLVVYHALDETSGTAANDSSGYQAGGNINGVYQGGAALNQAAESAFFGSAVRFDGNNDEVFLASPAALNNVTSNFTVAAWINPDDLNGTQRIFSIDSIDGNGWGFAITGDELQLTTYGKVDYVTTGIDLTAEEWAHVAVTFSASDNSSPSSAEFFVDGLSVGVTTIATSPQQGPAAVGTRNWFIGSTGRSEYFDGLLDEVRVYNRILTPGEIMLIANVPEPTSILLALLGGCGVATVMRRRRAAKC